MELITQKKGVFFSADALIAISIIFIFMLIAAPVIIQLRSESKIQYDVLSSLSSIKIGEINNTYVKSLIQTGVISDLSKTVLEQIGEFYSSDKDMAKNLAYAVLTDFDTRENIGIWYGNTLIVSKNSSAYEYAKNIDVATQIISGVKEGENITGYSARAYLSKALQSKYFYFGGFVGDGNITTRIDYLGNISSAEIEAAISEDFDLYVNNNFSGTFNKSDFEYSPKKYIIPIDNFHSGTNYIDFKSAKQLHIAGGYIKINYDSDVEYESPAIYYFPGIRGAINLYDGFFAQNLSSMKIYLHFNSSQETFLNIGNVTLLNQSTMGETIKIINSSEIQQKINFSDLNHKTIPLRLGLKNVSLTPNFTGNADIVLITDVSGSMNWTMNEDGTTGTERNCTNPLINDPSTKRVSIARCIDKDFVSTVLSGIGNRIALVSFSSSANSFINLTTNQTLLNTTINGYYASGSTCISCAINRAYNILKDQSNSSRQKYIISMTDGVPNVRSMDSCMNSQAISPSNFSAIAGDDGFISHKNELWTLFNSSSTNDLNDADMLNSTLGFAVGSSGKILKWNGINWTSDTSPTTENLYAVDIFNKTSGFAVGSSGKILKWNGSSWSNIIDIGSTTLRDVNIYNSTFGFAVGNNGEIYNWSGKNWSIFQTVGGGSYDLYAVDIFNKTSGFAVGESGKIYVFDGNSFSQQQDLGSMIITDINVYSNSVAYLTTDNNRIYKLSGASWSTNYTGSYDINSLFILNSSLAYAVGDSRGGIINWNGNLWSNSFPSIYYSGNSTSGVSCSDDDSCSLTKTIPLLNTNYSSCRVNSQLNTTVHSVGFGPISSCSFAIQNLKAISDCGNGTLYATTNSTLLQEFYQSIAHSILQISYNEQTSTYIGDLNSILYPDSYIELNYTKEPTPIGLIMSLEQPFTDNSTGTFYIPQKARLLEAYVTSYSGPRWTNNLLLNNQEIYNLSKYGSNYVLLGDPFFVYLPKDLINLSSPNIVNITTATSPTNASVGSSDNKIIYKIIQNISSYSNIKSSASGCNWTIELENGSSSMVAIPKTYSGSEICIFNSTLIQYNSNDALQVAVYNLLDEIDVNEDNKLDINLPFESLQISATQIQGIPYNWDTEVQVRIWS